MQAPDLDADPRKEPYRFLGINPTDGPDAFVHREKIDERRDELMETHDGRAWQNVQKAWQKIKEIHPERAGDNWRVPLILKFDSNPVTVGEAVDVKVRDCRGPVPRATIFVESSRDEKTDGEGRGAISVTRRTGDFEIKADKDRDGNVEYGTVTETLTVKPTDIELGFEDPPRQCVHGDELTVKVVDSAGEPVQDASVTPNVGSGDTTGSNGEATIHIDDVGSTTIAATKADTSTRSFTAARTNLTVDRRTVSLEFGRAPSTSAVSESERFRVTDSSGTGIEGVEVSAPNATAITGPEGLATIRFSGAAYGTTTVTATKDDTRAVTYSGVATTVEVEEGVVDLEISDCPPATTIGTETRVRVLGRNGDPEPDVTVGYGSTTDQTDENGWATLSFPPSVLGTVEVTASKDGPQGLDFDGADTAITVRKQSVELVLTFESAVPEIGDEVTFTVLDDDEKPQEGVRIEAGALETVTDNEGEATLTFEGSGSHTVTATKSDTPLKTFSDARIELDIARPKQRLVVTADRRAVELGDEVVVTVTAEDEYGTRIEGATVAGSGTNTATTNQHGKATLRFKELGEIDVTASKKSETINYIEGSVPVTVELPPESTLLVEAPEEVSVDQPVQFTINDYKREPVPNAEVKVISNTYSRYDETDENGIVEFELPDPGRYTVSVRKDGFDLQDEMLRVTE